MCDFECFGVIFLVLCGVNGYCWYRFEYEMVLCVYCVMVVVIGLVFVC